MTFGLENLFAFGNFFPISLHNTRDERRNDGGKGHNSSVAESLWGAKTFQQCHEHFFQNSTFASERPQVRTWGRETCFLLQVPSNLVMPLHNAHHDCLVKMAEFVYKNTRQSVANYQSQNF